MLLKLTENVERQIVWSAGANRIKTIKSWMIANRDETNTIYIGYSLDPHQQPELTGPDAIAASIVDPLGSVAVSPDLDWYAICDTATVQIDVIPDCTYWAPSPAQVAVQIAALGLAKDTSVNNPSYGPPTHTDVATTLTGAVNSPSYGPATHADVITTLPANIATSGVATNGQLSGGPIALPTGASKDSSLTTINGTLGSPAQDTIRASGKTIAADVAATGVPLITLSTSVRSASGSTLTAGSNTTTPTLSITQIGFELLLQLTAGSGSTKPFATVELAWIDSTSGDTVSEELYYLYQSAGTGGGQYAIRGPTRANQLAVTFTNNDSVTMTYSYVLLENSRIYDSDELNTISLPSVPTYTAGNSDPTAGVLVQTNPTIAASATITRWVSPYFGQVQFVVDNLGQANSLNAVLETQGNNVFATFVAATQVAAGGASNIACAMPRYGCALLLTNNGASGSIAPTVCVIASKQKP